MEKEDIFICLWDPIKAWIGTYEEGTEKWIRYVNIFQKSTGTFIWQLGFGNLDPILEEL